MNFLQSWIEKMDFLENFCQVIFILSETYFGRLNIYSYQIIKLAPLSQYSNSSKIWFIMVKVWWKSLFLTRNFAPFLKRCTDIKYIIRSRIYLHSSNCIFLSDFSDILNICLLMKLLELEDLLMVHKVRDDVYGDGEDDGAVVLGWDTVEGLEVSQLK